MKINSIIPKMTQEKQWQMKAPLSEGRRLILNHTARKAEILVFDKNDNIIYGSGLHKKDGNFLVQIFNWLKTFQNDTIGETDLFQEFIKSKSVK